jgi:tRNA(Glu) U13 pseudouridine synthase TruD
MWVLRRARLLGELRPLAVPTVFELSVGVDRWPLLSFTLPPGSYATAVLRELHKSDPAVVRLETDPTIHASHTDQAAAS